MTVWLQFAHLRGEDGYGAPVDSDEFPRQDPAEILNAIPLGTGRTAARMEPY